MADTPEGTWLGFTFDEWRQAYELSGMAKPQAWAAADHDIRAAATANGYMLDPFALAYISLVGDDCDRRVQRLLDEQPPKARREFTAALESVRRSRE